MSTMGDLVQAAFSKHIAGEILTVFDEKENIVFKTRILSETHGDFIERKIIPELQKKHGELSICSE